MKSRIQTDTERYNVLYRNGFFKSGLHGQWVMRMYKKNLPIERNYCEETFRTLPLTGITKAELPPSLTG